MTNNKIFRVIVLLLLAILISTPHVFAFNREKIEVERALVEIELMQIELNQIQEKTKINPRFKQDLSLTNLNENQKILYTECRKVGITDNAQMANVFAQVEIESGFVPKSELRASSSQYWLLALQNRYWFSGFYGRGLIQLTWQNNYAKMGQVFNIDLVNNPEKANDPVIAAAIACYGMKNGSFTGVKLDDYINNSVINYYQARRIVNSLDKAQLVHEKSMNWYNRLTRQF